MLAGVIDGSGKVVRSILNRTRCQQNRPNLAAKPTLRTALRGFTVDPMQPFAAMTHLNFEQVRKSAGRSAERGFAKPVARPNNDDKYQGEECKVNLAGLNS